MGTYNYTEVDVFSPKPYYGNPLAVVHDAESVSTEQMQRFAKWTNLSETTFLMAPKSPEADYAVRIFTATQEFPFAGHPTLGSAYAWLQAGGQPKNDGYVIQECGAGLVKVLVGDRQLAFQAPELTKYSPVEENILDQIAASLHLERTEILDASWLVNGPQWIGVRLADAEQVLALEPETQSLGRLAVGVIGPHSPGAEADFEVRAFIGDDPVSEDPVTGSLNAGLGQWLYDTGIARKDYTAAQGTAIGYQGRVRVSYRGSEVWVGGQVNSCVQGQVSF